MATSGAYTITMTATTMVNAIGRLVGSAPADMGDSVSAGEASAIIQAINMWLLQQKGPPNFMNPGHMMWTREEASLTLSAKSVYSLKPSGGDLDIQIPVQILTANLKDTDGNETTLIPMSLEEYQSISPKNQSGTPGRFYYEKRLDQGAFSLDYKPSDTTDVIDIVYRQPLEIISAGANEFDIEDWWYRAIKFNVALDYAPEAKALEPERIQLIADRAKESMMMVSRFNADNTFYYFQPCED